MITLFVLHAEADALCAEEIRTGLEARSYRTWHKPSLLTMESILYPSTIENVIVGSAAIVLLWSSAAAQSEWVERHLLFAQQLKKQLVPVLLDGTSLPTTLVADSTIVLQGSCSDVVAQLVLLLPDAQGTDALITVSEQAAHPYLRERRAAIEQAAQMLQRGEQSEMVLAILEYLARHDLMMGIREKAQTVLDAQSSRSSSPSPSQHFNDSRHQFGVRCRNGHISYFDKRSVCTITTPIPRGFVQRAGKKLDELRLTCDLDPLLGSRRSEI